MHTTPLINQDTPGAALSGRIVVAVDRAVPGRLGGFECDLHGEFSGPAPSSYASACEACSGIGARTHGVRPPPPPPAPMPR